MIWTLALWPFLTGLAIWVLGDRSRRPAGVPAALAMVVTLGLALAAGGWHGTFTWAPGLILRAELVPLSHPVAIMVPTVTLAVVLFAAGHEASVGMGRLMGLFLMFTGAMELVVIARDLVTLLIGWEAMGAVSWALIGHRWREAEAMLSANYAFVVTRAGDLGLFFAVFACFVGTGSIDYAALGRLEGWPLVVAAFGILVAAGAKAGQVPFSPWLFRAMAGPTSVSALLHSSTMVAAGAYLIASLHVWLSAVLGFSAAAIALGLATALAGGLVALLQLHGKKVLAGSTSAQLGLMFAAAGAGYPGVAVLHLIAHAFLKAPLFFAVGIAHERTETFDLRQMRLGAALPVVAGLTAIAALALAGVPPLGAAWTKEEIVEALGRVSPWLTLLTMVAGGLSAAYATRFAVLTYGPGDTEGESRRSYAALAALAALSGVTLALSALWWPLIHEPVAQTTGARLPESGSVIEMAASLSFVGVGLLAGLWLARHPSERAGAEWLGLAWLIEAGIVRPSLAMAAWAAWVDDVVFDAIPHAAAAAGRATSRVLRSADDHGIDGMNRSAGHGAVALVVRLAEAAAGGTSHAGERAFDLIPEGTGRLLGMAGGDLRRLQSGLSHHYYVILVAGFALGAMVLILGG